MDSKMIERAAYVIARDRVVTELAPELIVHRALTAALEGLPRLVLKGADRMVYEQLDSLDVGTYVLVKVSDD